ncbi:hypothetical protein D2L64_13710 [Micromonospora radicis]|uniref:DUF1795 domain-containing protein n=1 Tax=Micromonospora radicis TaxID=1894971 RepID=A0A418MUV8_9ACTN|nr:hypothetical protein D2L64_13710 [Micromonospora radicis]
MVRRGMIAAAVLVAGVLTGCGADGSSGDAEPTAGTATGSPWHDEVAAATGSGPVGAGTPCPLPVTFQLADGWRAAPVEIPDDADDPELAAALAEALIRRGGATVRCEVDGRSVTPGFLRVYTTEGAPRPALEAFVDAGRQVTEPQYRQRRSGDLDVLEASWLSHRELLDENMREWALAVQVGGQTVLIGASSTSFGDPVEVLPAYRLARETLAATS